MIRLFAPLALALAGCGYSTNELLEHSAVTLRIIDNQDERRTQEFDLTRLVARELAARGVHVNASDAPVALEGTILQITEPSIVEGQSDVVVVGAVSVRLQVVVRDRKTGREISRRERVETASFSSGRSESRQTARQEVFDRLARWVATSLERDW